MSFWLVNHLYESVNSLQKGLSKFVSSAVNFLVSENSVQASLEIKLPGIWALEC